MTDACKLQFEQAHSCCCAVFLEAFRSILPSPLRRLMQDVNVNVQTQPAPSRLKMQQYVDTQLTQDHVSRACSLSIL